MSTLGIHPSEETRKKISDKLKGINRSKETRLKMSYAKKKMTDETKKKISDFRKGKVTWNKGISPSEETRKKLSDANKGSNNPRYGKKHSEETKRKMRLSAIHRIEKIKLNNNKLFPMYNPKSISIIEEYGDKYGYNFQHAENGGEFYIEELGYWVDGYDKEKNVVIEYYEKAHNKRKQRDEQRKKEIINYLKCKFIEIRE